MNLNQNSSHYFMVFVVIAALALSMIPVLKKSFAGASDTFIISSLRKVQAEMFYHSISSDFYQACIRSSVVLANHDVIFETGQTLSCQVSSNYSSMAVLSQLSDGTSYCVDSNGFDGSSSLYIENGHCLK